MDSQILLALGDFGCMINLFNLLPVGMMDGGRIVQVFSPSVGVAGVGVAGGLILSGMVSNPIFYVITAAGGYQSGMRLWNQHQGIVDQTLPRNYYKISQAQKWKVGGSYVGLIAALIAAMGVNQGIRKSPEQLHFEQQISASSLVQGDDGIRNVYRD